MKQNWTRPLVLHVGFSKTASTSLQNHVFSKLEDVHNVGKPYADRTVQEVFRHVTFASTLLYEPDRLESFAQSVLDTLQEKHKSILISNEGFTYARHNDPGIIAERLKKSFGRATVLFTIREQASWAVSLYLDDLRRSPPGVSVGTIGQWCATEESKHSANVFSMSNYAPVIRAYISQFGRSNVFVLPFEYLGEAPEYFASCVGGLLSVSPASIVERIKNGVRENTRPSCRVYALTLGMNLFVPYFCRAALSRLQFRPIANVTQAALNGGRAATVRFPPVYREKLYRESAGGNRWISNEFGLDLSKLGYRQ